MGMADDARRLRHEREAAAGAQANAEQQDQQRRWGIIDAAVREFIDAATRMGVKPKGLFRPSWTVYLSAVPTNALDSWTKLVIRPDGRWEITNWVDLHSGSNKPSVVASSSTGYVRAHYFRVEDVRPRLVQSLSGVK